MADSAQGAGYAKPADPENPAVAVLDGDNATFWHTQWQGRASPLPHTLTIVMGGGVNRVSGFMVRSQRSALSLSALLTVPRGLDSTYVCGYD